MEFFVIIVNSFQPLTIITKCSILDVAAVLDPLLNKIPDLSLTFLTCGQHAAESKMVATIMEVIPMLPWNVFGN